MITPTQLENRAGLTPRQAQAVEFVTAYRDLTGEEPPARLVGRKLNVSRTAAFNLITRAKAKARPADPVR